MTLSVSGKWFRWLTRALLAIGLLLALAAPILRFWVTPGLAQSPLVPGDGGVSTHESTGTVTTLFDLETGLGDVVQEPIPVTRTQSTRGDAAAAREAADSGLNVWVSTTVDRTTTLDGRLIAETQYRLAADRHTQAMVDCCGAEVAGESVTTAGAGNPLRFPWFTSAAPYPFYDVALLGPVALTPLGHEDVGGILAMKFQQSGVPMSIGTVQAPGALTGSSSETVPLIRTRETNRTLWVDPTTGIILRQVERLRESLRDTEGKDIVTLVVLTTASTPEQVDAQAAAARQQGRPVLWTHSYGPVLALASGLLLIVLATTGMVLRTRAARVDEDFPDELASFEDLKEIFD